MGGPGHRIQGDHSLECSGRGPRGSEHDASCSRRASACIQARLRRSAYTVDTVATVRFIKEAQKLGFTLSEVETLLHLAVAGRLTAKRCERWRRRSCSTSRAE